MTRNLQNDCCKNNNFSIEREQLLKYTPRGLKIFAKVLMLNVGSIPFLNISLNN